MMIRAVAFAAAFLLAGAALAQTPSGTDTPAVEAAPAEPKQGTEAPAEGTAPAETEAEPSARPGGKPPVPEFQRRSGQRSGGPANDLNTPDSRARERLPGGSVTDTVTGRDLYHGNYCGRGNRGNGLPPVDELDAVCQRHDECYDAAQRPSCACDRALRRDAIAIADAAEVMRCQNP